MSDPVHKLAFLPVLLAAGCVAAAAYGAVHNQVSYTVSPEFFHADLFWRCRTPEPLWNRAGASLVGIQTTWWMGLGVGTPVFLLALIMPGWRAYVRHSLNAVGLVLSTAWAVGLLGLAIGYAVVDESNAPSNMLLGSDGCVRVGRAGLMHDFGYLGGAVGLVVAVVYLIVARVQIGKAGRRTG